MEPEQSLSLHPAPPEQLAGGRSPECHPLSGTINSQTHHVYVVVVKIIIVNSIIIIVVVTAFVAIMMMIILSLLLTINVPLC
jgi:hypothetical protein